MSARPTHALFVERIGQAIAASKGLFDWAAAQGGTGKLLVQVGLPSGAKSLDQAPAVTVTPAAISMAAGQADRPYSVACECRVRNNDREADTQAGQNQAEVFTGTPELLAMMDLVEQAMLDEFESDDLVWEVHTTFAGTESPPLAIGTVIVTWRVPVNFNGIQELKTKGS